MTVADCVLCFVCINNLTNIDIEGHCIYWRMIQLFFFGGSNGDDVTSPSVRDLLLIQKWVDQNVWAVNILKTKCMPIALKSNLKVNFNSLKLHICGDLLSNICSYGYITKVDSYKYLGLFSFQ